MAKTKQESAPSPAEELVEKGYAVQRIENETIMQIATRRPRDEDKILRTAIAELDRLPDLASRIYYSLPFKDHSEKGCHGEERKTCDCPVTYVRGLSIKGALNLARRWGNCVASVNFLGQDDDSIHLEGVFVDFETAALFRTPRVVSKFRRWGQRRVQMREDDLDKHLAANASKAKRNAIRDGLPDWFVESYYRHARELAVEIERQKAHEADVSIHERVCQSFGQLGVTQAMLEQYLNHPIEEITDTEVADLRGIKNAIRDKETTVEEVFLGGADEEEATPKPDNAGGAAARMAGAGAKMTEGDVADGAPQEKRPEDAEQEPPEADLERMDESGGHREETRAESPADEDGKTAAPAPGPAGDVEEQAEWGF